MDFYSSQTGSGSNERWKQLLFYNPEFVRARLSAPKATTTMEALVGFASLLAKRGAHQHAPPLLLLSLDHPATIAETKVRAGKLAHEVKAKLTPQEIESAQTFASDKSVDSVVREILTSNKI